MQWGQIKSLFIVCFLVLDVFLIKQLIDKQEDVSFITESTKEEQLQLNINGLDDLSEDTIEAPLIYAVNQSYSAEDSIRLEQYSNQKNVIVDEIYLFGQFDEPIPISIDEDSGVNMESLNSLILNSGEYTYWGKDEKSNSLLFFQTMEQPIYYNQNALLFIQLNDDDEMIQYVQTKLEQEEEQEEARDLITEIDAVSRLFHNAGSLEQGDTVTDVALGYHNVTSLPNGLQILNPTWNVTVDQTDHYFVNAIEGHDYPKNDDFIKTAVESFQDVIQTASTSDFQFIQAEDAGEETELIEEIELNLLEISNAIIGVEEK
ncbi:two-component system regulatory protein YycI [Paraliobacillus sp. X-1268]|uniref:two-component system regulatory protein YycI n=1 Tax=Paraliobacillus sp. X-1268 TaxID=2213193 RepID=UPI001300AF16|nr:two-component system regulatory protein YycI [Paraliobacillus sp. X-1268]